MTERTYASATEESCSDARLDMEFAYTTWQQSCRDLYTIGQACRRPRSHEGQHAAGYGRDRARWTQWHN
jgi:hypothetical protein